MSVLLTPDGRYLVVRGRLWRAANPALSDEKRQELVEQLMQARRAIRQATSTNELAQVAAVRRVVHATKVELGERGPVWWHDGTRDYNRHLAKNTPYASWYRSVTPSLIHRQDELSL